MASPQEIAKIQSGDPGANVSTRQSIRQAILNETRRREALIKKINQLTAEAEAKANKKGGLASLRLKDIGTGKNLKRIETIHLNFYLNFLKEHHLDFQNFFHNGSQLLKE